MDSLHEGRAVNRGVIEHCVRQRRKTQHPDCAAPFTGAEVTQKKDQKPEGLNLYLYLLETQLFHSEVSIGPRGH